MLIGKVKAYLLLAFICMASVSATMITPALSEIGRHFALSSGSLEWVVSIYLAGYVLGQLVYGPVANRYGRITALRFGMWCNFFGTAICIFSGYLMSYPILLFGRFISGVGAAAGLVTAFILINELLPKDQAKRVMAFAGASFTIAVGLAVLTGGLLTEYSHWMDSFWALLVHDVILLSLTCFYPETLTKKKTVSAIDSLKKYAKIIKDPKLIIFSLMVGMATSFAYCYSAFSPLYAESTLHLSPSQYSYWNWMTMIGMFISSFLCAYLLKKYPVRKVVILALLALIPCLISFVLLAHSSHPTSLWFFMTTMVMYLFPGMLYPTGSYLASNVIEDKASATSIMCFINMSAATLSVIILGYLPFTSRLIAYIWVLFGYFLLICICSAWYFKSPKKVILVHA